MKNFKVEKIMKLVTIESLNLSSRALNCLEKVGVKTVKDLMSYTDYTIIPGIGVKTATHIKEQLELYIKAIRKFRDPENVPNGLFVNYISLVSDVLKKDIDRIEENSILAKNFVKVIRARLTPEERNLICYKYALDGGDLKSLNEVSDYFEVSIEKIKMAEMKIFDILFNHKRLRSFYMPINLCLTKNTDIRNVALSYRTYKCLFDAGYRTVGDLLLNNNNFNNVRNLSLENVEEINSFVASFN